jgi:anti-anti-sigma factor
MTQSDLYETDRIGDIFVIRFLKAQMLDANLIPTRQDEIKQLIATSDAARIVLDLSNIGFLCSTGLGMLVAVHNHCSGLGRTLELCSPQPQILEMMTIMMFQKLFPIHDSLATACSR